MTSTTYAPRFEQQRDPSYCSQILDGVSTIGMSAGAGALAGYLFSIVNPVGGAVFGGTSALISLVGNKIAQRVGVNSFALRVALYAVAFFASIAVSAIATTALGFPLTVSAGVILSIGMLVSQFAINLAIGGAKCASACVAGGALAVKERCC
jgi:hypothetical protein